VGKFDKFKIEETEQELERLRDEYWEKVKRAPKPGSVDKATELWIRNVIMRHGWLRSKLRSSVIQAARIERGRYRCACCKGEFKSTEIEVDHKYSRVGFEGEVTLQEFVNNTFCSPEGLSALCKSCHRHRTSRERAEALKKRK
jgi:5-methylcytosine-specific restriction endonuclease McrA